MAAGLGKRMRSRTPKVLHPILGRPMLAYVVDAAREATGTAPIVVYSPATAALREALAGADVEFVLQEEPRGTGDAVRAALASVPKEIDEVLVVSGDVPLVLPETLRELLEQRRLDEAALALVAVTTFEPAGLGRVIRSDQGFVEGIVEETDATPEERDLDEINAGLYAFDTAWLRQRIRDLAASSATGELYLTELVALARRDGRLVASLDLEDDGRLLGINDRAQLAAAEWDMRTELNQRHMRAGVTMGDPSTAYIEPTVELAADVVLEPNVILRGSTRVGEGSLIRAGSQLFDAVIGRDCVVWASIIESSELEDGVSVGPFSRIRGGSRIGRGVRVGNYAEIKNSRLAQGVKQNHFSYLGDADVGAGTNIGAGAITANWDGIDKHPTTIGEGVFIGVDTMLIAPVSVGDGAKTGAGAVVTKDVPPDTLAVGVPARIRELKGKPPEEPKAPR
jgi:bifunctional UDP-N-acetylglucosamine pyrophosphorylase/glucosamine-1-phosphate N-acetyltransferase